MSKLENSKPVAVITGDIVRSTELAEKDFNKVQANLKQALETICKLSDGFYEKFRGDSFQLYVKQGSQALKYATLIRLALYYQSPHVEVRQSIGVGKIQKVTAELNSIRGKAFELSGRGLDKMTNQRLSLEIDTNESINCVNLLVQHLDTLLSNLTKDQAWLLHAFLLHEKSTHKELAALVGKSRVNTTQILNASHYRLVGETLAFVSNVISGIKSVPV